MNAVLGARLHRWFPVLRIDPWLTGLLLILMVVGLAVLYSASEQDIALVGRQAARFGAGLAVLFVASQVSPQMLRAWTPWLYIAGVLMLLAVWQFGVGRGAQRWLDLGLFRFQPSEIMKLAIPLALAAWLHRRPLPPGWIDLGVCALLIALPVLLIAQQPDLGTAMLVTAGGLAVLFLAGLKWRVILLLVAAVAAALPVLWMNLLDYQRNRVLSFLNPESDPLGHGWNIIQSKIAVGSGGLSGKGWLAGSQSHLEFLPEPHTDFIFAVLAEEFGFIGVIAVLALYAAIILRGLHLAGQMRDVFARVLSGSLVFLFFIYVAVNAAMVTGVLPVVGVPLPLISYGGTSAATLLAGFGIIMGLYSRRRFMG